MSSTSTPQPTVPSVQQESTFEEDYFAELLLDDDVDAELDSVVKPQKKSREERMNEAVEISKREYKYEHGITEQWVSRSRTYSSCRWEEWIWLMLEDVLGSVVVFRARQASSSLRTGPQCHGRKLGGCRRS
jgi:hypothetical protein